MVVEVKSNLKERTFHDILGVWRTTDWLPVPTLGFAYDGVAFKTFLGYVIEAIKNEEQGIPECIAVHRQNYLIVRSSYRLAPDASAPKRHRPAEYHFAVDFRATDKGDGSASAAFLDFYDRLLSNGHGWMDETHLRTWFNRLDLPQEQLVRITNDGVVNYGPIPEVCSI